MIKGKIVALGQSAGGTKKDGQPWKKQEYILETVSKFPNKVCFSVLNEKIEEFNLQVGSTVDIDFNVKSREFNGRWYTELTAWRVAKIDIQQTQQQKAVYQQQAPQNYAPTVNPTNGYGQPAQPPQTMQSGNDDLPF